MSDLRTRLIQQLHRSPNELVVVATGGGSLAVGDLLCVPGGSKTLLEAIIPYTHAAIDQFIGRTPERYCNERTARLLAMSAFHRGKMLIQARKEAVEREETAPSPDSAREMPFEECLKEEPLDLDDFRHLVGVGCTASLSTDREKKGEYRVCIATQTLRRTTLCSLHLLKGVRTRLEEERLVADLILNMIENVRQVSELATNPCDLTGENIVNAPVSEMPDDPAFFRAFSRESCDNPVIEMPLPLHLKEGERMHTRCSVAMPPLVDLFFGRTVGILWRSGQIEYMKSLNELQGTTAPLPFNPHAEFSNVIFPGSFNPIHEGHFRMVKIAREQLSSIVSLELSVFNARKPPIDYMDLMDRLEKIEAMMPGQPVWLTRLPTFGEKSLLFPGTMFVVGADTLARFAELKQYDNNPHNLHDLLRDIGFRECRFYVFARHSREGILSLETLDIPDMLRSLCDAVSTETFCLPISSSELRRQEKF